MSVKVVLLCRVSTNHQDYERQVVELTNHCEQMGWEICRIFANKISGAVKIEEREEICELVSFVKQNQIHRVVCLECYQTINSINPENRQL